MECQLDVTQVLVLKLVLLRLKTDGAGFAFAEQAENDLPTTV
jgi:hypothetical protein